MKTGGPAVRRGLADHRDRPGLAGSAVRLDQAASRRARSTAGPAAPGAAGRARNFGPDAKPQRGGSAKGKKKDDQRPRGPIPVKTDRRSYSLDDDSPEVKLDDFDDFATSKPGEEPEKDDDDRG